MVDYTPVLIFFKKFFSNAKNGKFCAAKKRRNMLKKEKRKVKKKIIFNEEIRHRAEYESRCMSLGKDNRLLKQSLRQFRNQSLVRRRYTNLRIYWTIMSIYKDKKNALIAKFRKALPSFKYRDLLHGKTIGPGGFETVKLDCIVRIQQSAAIKSICDKSLESTYTCRRIGT